MLDRGTAFPLDVAEEVLLLALVACSCPLAQVDFDPDNVGAVLGWEPERASRTFGELKQRGYLRPLREMPTRSQIDLQVVEWVWRNATREIHGTVFPNAHQEAAQFLLLLRLHSGPDSAPRH
jgi:hypothetical protein